MPKDIEIAVFEGDGIGPEIMGPTIELLTLLSNDSADYTLAFHNLHAGAAHYAKTGESLPEASLSAAKKADAILLSAMGLPSVRYEDGTEISPQIELRKAMDLYAGVRPVMVLPGQDSPLNLPNGKSIDFVLIRESTEGLFHSQGNGQVNENEARETMLITRKTSEKLFDFAFDLASKRATEYGRSGKVTCVDKANVFRAFAFFREIFDERAARHPALLAEHSYVDAIALWMVQKPWEFDVLVTENMFGDILSDLGAGLMGGLGLAPSADIGDRNAVFQPCHGSAPDIAGQGVANPAAMMLSAAMMLNWLGHQNKMQALIDDGKKLDAAVRDVVLSKNGKTRDLGGSANTSTFFEAVKGRLS